MLEPFAFFNHLKRFSPATVTNENNTKGLNSTHGFSHHSPGFSTVLRTEGWVPCWGLAGQNQGVAGLGPPLGTGGIHFPAPEVVGEIHLRAVAGLRPPFLCGPFGRVFLTV